MSLCTWTYAIPDPAVTFETGPWRAIPARAGEKRTSMQILNAVAQSFSVDVDALKSDRRDRAIAHPRFAACLLLRRERHMSFEQIGRQLGGRDHSTIMHGCREAKRLLDVDAEFAAQFEAANR